MLRRLQRTDDPESTTRLGSKWLFRSKPLSSYLLLRISRGRRVRFAGVASANRTAPRASSSNPLAKQQGSDSVDTHYRKLPLHGSQNPKHLVVAQRCPRQFLP